MGRLASFRTLMRLARGDFAKHGGDIAILKMDLVGVQATKSLEPKLAPVDDALVQLDVAPLRALKEGSFGREYARFLDANSLHPLVLTDAVDEATRERNAYGIRYAATHDMIHVLLGCGPDYPGELGVLAFTCGQGYSFWLWLQALFAWLLYPLLSGFRLRALLGAWRRGYRLGKRAPIVLETRLEDHFIDDLDELRTQLGLIRDDGSLDVCHAPA